jgi:hypothetical protein
MAGSNQHPCQNPFEFAYCQLIRGYNLISDSEMNAVGERVKAGDANSESNKEIKW